MGKQQSKEETVIVQNAAGGSNYSEEIRFHMSTTNILLTIIVLAVLLGTLYIIYRIYRRCHRKWITEEINKTALRRSVFRRHCQQEVADTKRYAEDAV